MSEFTKEQLVYWSQTQPLAAFALAQMERAEERELTLNAAIKSHLLEVDKRKRAEAIAAGNLARAENAEAERDDAIERWARRAKEAEARLESVEAERDRLREELREAEEAIRRAAWNLSDCDNADWTAWHSTPAVRRARERGGR